MTFIHKAHGCGQKHNAGQAGHAGHFKKALHAGGQGNNGAAAAGKANAGRTNGGNAGNVNAGQAFGGINPNTNAGLTKLANIINQATGGKIKLVEAGGVDTREGGSRIYVKDGKIQSVQIWGNQALSQKLTQKLQGTTIYSGNNIPQDDTPLGMVHNAGYGNYGAVSVVGNNANGGGWGKPAPLPGKPTVCPMPKPMPVPYNGGGMQVAQGGQVAGAGHAHAAGNVQAGGHVHATQGAGQAAGGHAGHAHHAENNDGNVGGILGGIFGLKSGLLGGLANLFSKKSGILGAVGGLAAPVLGIFSKLVGHDGAQKAAMNGDLGGWLVNTFDHTSHSHALGGNEGNGNGGLLGITNIAGTLGQEAGHILGLDKVFGDAKQYDAQNGTDYAKGGGEPKHFL